MRAIEFSSWSLLCNLEDILLISQLRPAFHTQTQPMTDVTTCLKSVQTSTACAAVGGPGGVREEIERGAQLASQCVGQQSPRACGCRPVVLYVRHDEGPHRWLGGWPPQVGALHHGQELMQAWGCPFARQ